MNPIVKKLLTQVDKQPSHPAVVTENETVTYSEFGLRVKRFAQYFSEQLSNIDCKAVAIALPQGADAYAAMYATLLAGGYYVPLNLKYPPSKLAKVIEDVVPAIIVTNEDCRAELPNSDAIINIASIGTRELEQIPKPHHLAYITFTSGSTGKPKGVMISQPALTHYVNWVEKNFKPTAADRWSQHPNIAFDLSVLDIYGSLPFGATLYPLASDISRILPATWIKENKITIWDSVPSMIDLMIKSHQMTSEFLSTVRRFNFCGEPLMKEQVKSIFEAVPNAEVQNTYGPTEATVSCTEFLLTCADQGQLSRATVSLGKPIEGMTLLIVDNELVLSGPQLADGYWNDQQKTQQSFRPVILKNGESIQGYWTGDIVERDENGHLYFSSRKDRQVKIHGYRIELDEVSSAIRQCSFQENSVIVHENSLFAFVVMAEEKVDLLRLALEKIIEHHSIPQYIVPTDQLLRNQNDKIDTQRMLQDEINRMESVR